MSPKKIRIVLAGGGTGGHIYPLLAVAEELSRLAAANGEMVDLHYIGSAGSLEKEISEAGIKTHPIMSGKFRRYFSLMNIVDIPKILIGFVQAFLKMYAVMPDAVFSKGGPGALQAALAAWFYRIPILVHESDAYPGLTNLLSSRLARKVAISFPAVSAYFPPPKIVLTGNPIRPSLGSGRVDQISAKEVLGFDTQKPLLLVLGGSQGSVSVNDFVISTLKELLPETQVLHQTGAANFALSEKLARAALVDVSVAAEVKNRYKPVSYLGPKEMSYALSAADLVIARAGSGTIFEIASFGKPSILIPLPEAAGDHQRENAYAYAAAKAAFVIEEANFSPQILLSQLKKVLGSPELSRAMSDGAKAFAKPQAAETLALELLSWA